MLGARCSKLRLRKLARAAGALGHPDTLPWDPLTCAEAYADAGDGAEEADSEHADASVAQDAVAHDSADTADDEHADAA